MKLSISSLISSIVVTPQSKVMTGNLADNKETPATYCGGFNWRQYSRTKTVGQATGSEQPPAPYNLYFL
ncbi:hypothetical protein [Chitinophaga vietnamensis]|uniref:hypothetical protein n=1 Tax=Chitinophaga vietnamensis TaxID=2593957 RepID=UPI0011785C71|nr:hypothetical protein [Chitinophaga vietnamensis]